MHGFVNQAVPLLCIINVKWMFVIVSSNSWKAPCSLLLTLSFFITWVNQNKYFVAIFVTLSKCFRPDRSSSPILSPFSSKWFLFRSFPLISRQSFFQPLRSCTLLLHRRRGILARSLGSGNFQGRTREEGRAKSSIKSFWKAARCTDLRLPGNQWHSDAVWQLIQSTLYSGCHPLFDWNDSLSEHFVWKLHMKLAVKG